MQRLHPIQVQYAAGRREKDENVLRKKTEKGVSKSRIHIRQPDPPPSVR